MPQVARIDFERIERPSITVNMAGDVRELPVTFNDADLKLVGSADDTTAGITAFFAKYLGEVVHELGDDQLSILLNAWIEQRKAIGAPELGE